ncbi:MAG: ribosomal protein [Dehalococcoidales bacterium]|nr:ribosomal protein [Dehalococcoidales bacterium]
MTFRRSNIYAIIEASGKQYKVTPGQLIELDHQDIADGATIELDKVLLIGDGDKVTIGTPTIAGAKVIATSRGDSRGKKVIVFRYKSKTRYRRKKGHRQDYTGIIIEKIVQTVAAENEPVEKPS